MLLFRRRNDKDIIDNVHMTMDKYTEPDKKEEIIHVNNILFIPTRAMCYFFKHLEIVMGPD